MEETTPTEIRYKRIKFSRGRREGKCPRGKKTACRKCYNLLLVENEFYAKCLDFDTKSAYLHTLAAENGRFDLQLSYKDSVIFDGLIGPFEINGKLEVQSEDHLLSAVPAIAKTFNHLLSTTNKLTLISE